MVSVVILNYNGKEFVGDCIDSVLKSSYSFFEIVVVDNGSFDDSYSFLKKRYKKEKKVKLFRLEKNKYFTGGFNFGVKKAKGKKIVFLSNDIVVEKDFLKEMVKFVGDKKKILVQPKILSYREKNKIDNVGGRYFLSVGGGRGSGKRDRGQYDQNSRVDFAASAVFMMDRDFFWELGGYDEWFRYYYEDVDLNLKAKRMGGESWYCFKARVYHKGSLTVKKYADSTSLWFCVRKNMVWTVINNFFGVELFCRLLALYLMLFLIVIRDLFFGRFEMVGKTIMSQVSVWRKLKKDQPWIRSHL